MAHATDLRSLAQNLSTGILREMQAKLTEAVGLYNHLATARAAAVEQERAAAEVHRRSWQQPAYGYPHHQAYPSSSSSSALPQGGYPYAHQPPPPPVWGSDPYGQQHQQPYEPYGPGQHAYDRPSSISQTPSWSGYPSAQPYEPQQQQHQAQHLSPAIVGGGDVYPQLPEHQPSQPPQQNQQQQPSYPVEPYPPAENAWAGQRPTLHSPPTSPVQQTPSYAPQQPQQPKHQLQPEQAPLQPSYFPPAQLQQQQPSSPAAPTASASASAFPTAPVSQPLSSAFPAVPDEAPAESDRATAEWAAVDDQQHQRQQQQQRSEPEEALLISF
jgi:hypothetical protein